MKLSGRTSIIINMIDYVKANNYVKDLVTAFEYGEYEKAQNILIEIQEDTITENKDTALYIFFWTLQNFIDNNI